jgi:hypothetical protein
VQLDRMMVYLSVELLDKMKVEQMAETRVEE